MSFFIRNKNTNSSVGRNKGGKGKRQGGDHVKGGAPKSKRRAKGLNDEIDSDSDIDVDVDGAKQEDYSSSEDEETAQEKRLRLAKTYLSQLEEEEAQKASDDEENGDSVAQRLKKDVLEQAGRLQKKLAQYYLQPRAEDVSLLRGHQLPATCAVISPDEKFVYSAGKDCSIIKWSVDEKKKVKTVPGGRKGTEEKHIGHTTHILALALSSDGKFLVSGDMNKLIYVWNPETLEKVHILKGHRGAVSGLAFRRGTHQLFSTSHDKTVKVWNLDEMAFVETLFGHQDMITGVDCLTRERAITCGARDNSIRIWKIVEESQLVFNGHGGSVDSVALINEEHFISGSDDNSLSLWSVMKKKPLQKKVNAHAGVDNDAPDQNNWISAVAALTHTDLVASGSKDGCIRLWKCGQHFKTLEPLHNIPVPGFVNSLAFSPSGKLLVAAVGQEHKLGRWWRKKEAKNGICIINLRREDTPEEAKKKAVRTKQPSSKP